MEKCQREREGERGRRKVEEEECRGEWREVMSQWL